MKHIRTGIAASAVAVALLPFFTGALTIADLQAQIQTLLAQIATLQQQMSALQPVATSSVINIPSAGGVSGTVSVPPASSSGVICPVFNFTFSRGSKGDAVTALQKFLVAQGFLSNDSVTGFFGPMTESAVRNFQAAQGIIAAGTASSTGWGVVGQTTSAAIVKVCSAAFTTQPAPPTPTNPSACTAIALSCPSGTHDQVGANCSHACVSGTATSSCAAMLPPTSSCSTGWKANADTKGCTISYSCTTTTSTSSGCPYYPVPDCGTGMSSQWAGNDGRGCSLGYSCVPSQSVLSCPLFSLPACSGTLVAQGTGPDGCQLAPLCVGGTTSTNALSASPALGTAPLAVIFTSSATGNINFGDGTTGTVTAASGACTNSVPAACGYSISHTYTSAGTYAASLTGNPTNGGFPALVGTATITVTSAKCPLSTMVVDCAPGYHYTGNTYTTDSNGCSVAQMGQCVPN